MPSKQDIEALGKTRQRRWPAWLALFVVALAAAGSWWAWQSRSSSSAVSYNTSAAEIRDITVAVTATGTIEPTSQVDISSELSGTVRSVEVDFNDVVKKGEVLAKLDTDKLQANTEASRAALAARQAALLEAGVTLEESKAAYERTEKLNTRGISTTENLLTAKAVWQRAEAALKTAEANVKAAEADLKMQETNLAKACICSPIDGIVLDRDIEPGQIVASTLQAPTLFTVAANLTAMELTVAIDEADIGQVKIGHEANFTVEAYQTRTFHATITELRYVPQTVDGVVTYEAILDVDNNELLLRPGMTATADIVVEQREQVLTVSNAALRFAPEAEADGGGGSGLLGMLMPRRPGSGSGQTSLATGADGMRPIWVLKDGKPEEVRVQTGSTDGTVTEIVAGDLKAGDLVVTGSVAAK